MNQVEYSDVMLRLNEIESEELLLKELNNNNNYNAHVDLASTFPELLISLKRENEDILRQLTFYSKKIILFFDFKINYAELLSILCNDTIPEEFFRNESFLKIYPEIKKLLNLKKANEQFYQYIYSLLSEKNMLISKRNEYLQSIKKRKKKKLFFK